VTVKNAVYALPNNTETREDFAWLAKEIVESGGEAVVCEAALVDGLPDGELQGLFDTARDEDYARIASEARDLRVRLGEELPDNFLAEVTSQATRLRKQLDAVVAIDFFGAEGRAAAEGLVSDIEVALKRGEGTVTTTEPSSAPTGVLKNRIWVTRQGVQVDRIASAWLIRRFIDEGARFKFVPGKACTPESGELRFDMFEGEFTHRGDRCTFEVLVEHAGLADPALTAIGEIIHDIDLKDDKYGREETAGIKNLIAGIAASHNDDEQRLVRGAAVFDDLYQYLRTVGAKTGAKN
jgi:hypothetical protein